MLLGAITFSQTLRDDASPRINSGWELCFRTRNNHDPSIRVNFHARHSKPGSRRTLDGSANIGL